MSNQKNSSLNVEEALSILREYSCIQIKPVNSEAEKQKLRQALLLINGLSDYENLGICADNSHQGYGVLTSYLQGLGYEIKLDSNSFSTSDSPVYIKYNSQKMSHFLDSYTGTYRGVIVSCQSEDDNIVGTYGHFPLDLFN